MFPEGLRRILCPVDFSDYSATALRAAGNLAQVLGAEVTVLHAQPVDAPAYFTPAQIQSLKAQLRLSRKAAERHMADFAEKFLSPGVSRSLQVAEGDAVQVILETTRRVKAGMVVMGTHGHTGLTKVRLGSVMEGVLFQLEAPLVTVGPHVENTPAVGALRRIVCAVDYSSASRRALEHGIGLAEKFGAEIYVVHVVEKSESLAEERRSLCDWVNPALRSRCSLTEVVRHGNPAEQIVALSESDRASLVVMGAEPRHFLGSLFFGTTVERVIRHAKAPVLSVR